MTDDHTCPVCRSSRTVVFAHFTPHDAARWFCPASRDVDRHTRLTEEIRRLWKGDAEFRMCQDCDFAFSAPHVAGSGEFYAILHEQAGYPNNRWEYGRTVAASDSSTAERRNALDIGAGGGAFLNQLGGNWNLHCTESSDKLRNGLKAMSVDARRDLSDFEEDGRFHLITMFQVIEHFADPDPLLREVRRLLHPSGIFCVSTPHGPGQREQQRLTRSSDVPPNHVSIYGEKSMAIVLGRHGLEVVSSDVEPSSWSRVLYVLQIKTKATAHARKPPAAWAANVKNQRLRHMAMRGAALFALPAVLADPKSAMASANFLTIARPTGTGSPAT